MPYKMIKLKNRNLYQVINTKTKQIHAHNSTKHNAEMQIKILNMIDNKMK